MSEELYRKESLLNKLVRIVIKSAEARFRSLQQDLKDLDKDFSNIIKYQL